MSEIKNNKKIKMPSSMTIGPPTLRVRDLQKQLSFYENDLGLQVNRTYRADDNLETIDLGFKGKFTEYKEPLLILKHDPNAKQTNIILQDCTTLQYLFLIERVLRQPIHQ